MILMSNSEYHAIKTYADVQEFQEISNGLHDGFITHVEYNNTGITSQGNILFFDYAGKSLIIRVLVTSIDGHPTFELSFHNVYEWQINDFDFSDMIGCSIVFLENNLLLWGNDICSDIELLKQGCYVVAESMQYRKI